jgi:hypothetical protein
MKRSVSCAPLALLLSNTAGNRAADAITAACIKTDVFFNDINTDCLVIISPYFVCKLFILEISRIITT